MEMNRMMKIGHDWYVVDYPCHSLVIVDDDADGPCYDADDAEKVIVPFCPDASP